MCPSIDLQTTVGQLVAQVPARSRVFEQLGVDYCCGGKQTLEKACSALGLVPSQVAVMLADAAPSTEERATLADADSMSLTELTDHIVGSHHAFLRGELPRLERLAERVARAHLAADPRLADVYRVVCEFRTALVDHMTQEEQALFPIMRALESDPETSTGAGVSETIRQMEAEHDEAGRALARLRELTEGFQPPEWACNTYLALLDGLATLEQDMHQHVHKENNILFPKAIAAQCGAGARGSA
ncbi:MAG: iron-sulfur cluster repair di-iron protein [Phycisphaerales bacterium]|nr:iron-sulfur cluster repair di-iron protein [Phycisphaerales bacterium]